MQHLGSPIPLKSSPGLRGESTATLSLLSTYPILGTLSSPRLRAVCTPYLSSLRRPLSPCYLSSSSTAMRLMIKRSMLCTLLTCSVTMLCTLEHTMPGSVCNST